MAVILCTGVDPGLMRTRQLILQQAGHQVVVAVDDPAIKAACKKQRFDVAVIGQTVSAKRKQQIMGLVRKHCPAAKVLELYPAYTGKVLEDADSWLQVPADLPQELASRVSALMGNAPSPKKIH